MEQKNKQPIASQEAKNLVKEIREEKKFNVKAWLLASIFSITSCLIGIINLILHFVDK